MAALLPSLVITGQLNRVVVLVVAASDAYIGQAGMFDLVETCHQNSPAVTSVEEVAVGERPTRQGPAAILCYTAKGRLHR